MERRNFIQLGLMGFSAGIFSPLANAAETARLPVTADLVYSQGSQGRWAGKAATHLPTIEISQGDGKITASVVTAHEMNGFEHYIVKHVLLDKNHAFIAEHMFNPMADKTARSEFALDNYRGTLYALSLCNKHDLWISSIEI